MKIGLFIFSCLLVSALSAQTGFRFAQTGATWNVLYEEQPGFEREYITRTYTIVSDTLIRLQAFQRIQSSSGSAWYIRCDSVGRVFRNSGYDTSQLLIYDFSKTTGETFKLDNRSGIAGLDIVCHVDSTNTVVLGRARKRMYITYNNTEWRPDVWIEGIGSIQSHMLFPGSDHTLTQVDWNTLLCFTENDSILYQDKTYQRCSLDTVIYESTTLEDVTASHVNIWPNPVTGNLLNVSLAGEATFALYDITGKLVHSYSLRQGNNQLPLQCSKGIYHYQVNGNRQKTNGKIVVLQ